MGITESLRHFCRSGWPAYLIPLAVSVYYAVVMPVSYDEAWTYIHFTHKGFITSVTHYPAPNNHILHSVLTNITKYIPLWTDLLKLRVSSIVANFVSLIVLYRLVSAHYNTRLALAVVAVSSMLFMNVYYSYMSRGYALYNLFFISALFAAFNIIKNLRVRRNWILLSVCCILGLCTVPTFVYAVVILHVFVVVSLRKLTRAQIISGYSIVLGTALLYLPVVWYDGIGALTKISHKMGMTFYQAAKSMPGHYLDMFRQISGVHWILFLILLGWSCFRLLKTRDRNDLTFAATMLVLPAVILPIHHLVPFVRVFNYYSAIFVLIILLPYTNQIGRLRLKVLLPILIGIQSLLLLNFSRAVLQFEEKDLAINLTADRIIPEIIGEKRYFFDGVILCTNLEFHLITEGYKKYKITDCEPFPLNTDTLSGYDYAFVRRDMDKTARRTVFFKTPYYNIYKIK
ncbi:hypothetical protein HYN48_14600 [Flavobacterium magnum]|uniref:Glycosyltransferase RgtA/B/C/D-like domain-containing protein n=1 Tax=Flavobacterium magnum TaxID=2162713 RepID=A0A2S0RH20_9FLAO|nr:hypothetical protein [Flavobacterium magnum]AWA31227.1 hypothetical protein HYN48_14600 [Flavobacterium magnum]